MSTIALTQVDNGKSIELSRGDALTIHLPENPTTGYRWAIDDRDNSVKEPKDEVVTLESSSYVPAPQTGVGGGGERTMVFKAANAGATQLQLKLWEPWEGDGSVVERFSVTIQVRD